MLGDIHIGVAVNNQLDDLVLSRRRLDQQNLFYCRVIVVLMVGAETQAPAENPAPI